MQTYYVNRQAQNNGDHEVHDSGCRFLAIMSFENREKLGYFDGCRDAVREAKNRGYHANGCFYCCNACHTG